MTYQIGWKDAPLSRREGVFETNDEIGIDTKSSTIRFDRKSGNVTGLAHRDPECEWMAENAGCDLFTLNFSAFGNADPVRLLTPELNEEWTLFLNPENPDDFGAVPERMHDGDGEIFPQTVRLTQNAIDLARLAGNCNSAVLFNDFIMPDAGTIRLGFAADWWFELYINGQKAYSTYANGNETTSYSPDNHVVEIPVRRGRNILAVKVTGGSDGWSLVCGTPSGNGGTRIHRFIPPVRASEFGEVSIKRIDRRSLKFEFTDHPACRLRASVHVHAEEDGLLHLRIAVENETGMAVTSIQFFRVAAAFGEDGKVLVPSITGHQLFEGGNRSDAFFSALYPASMDMQFMAAYNPAAGVYMAAYDPDGHYKRMSVVVEKNRNTELRMEHLLPECFTGHVELAYDAVVGTFRGDWHAAADLYKRWATKQAWCARKIYERDDIPVYFKEGSAVFCVPFLHEMVQYKLYPFECIEGLPLLAAEYRKRTGIPHCGFIPMGWENRGSWAGINYFPARPSDEVWKKVNAELKEQGDFTFMLPSGFSWVVKRRANRRMGPAVDDWADFEKRGEMTVHDETGNPHLNDRFLSDSYVGLSAMLCHGSAAAGNTVKEFFLRIARLGVSVIQFDQDGGGQLWPCYAKHHGHLPGFTNEYSAELRKLYGKIIGEGKQTSPEFGLSLEGCSEYSIPFMATMYGRQCSEADALRNNLHSVGAFSYIYHEYIPVLGDGFSIGQGMLATLGSAELRCYRMAKALTIGLIPTVYMEQVPLHPENEWQRLVSTAFFAYCRPFGRFQKYLIEGITRPTPKIECAGHEVWYYHPSEQGETLSDGRKAVKVAVTRPSVIAGCFEANDRSLAVIIVNTTPDGQSAEVETACGNRPAKLLRVDGSPERCWETGPTSLPLTLNPFEVKILVVSAGRPAKSCDETKKDLRDECASQSRL